MRTRLLASLLPLLLFACGSSSSEHTSATPGEVFRLEGDHPLEAELQEVKSVGDRKVTTRIVLRNPGTKMISFKRAEVRLSYNGVMLEARDLRAHEIDVDVAPGESKTKYWAFHTEGPPVAGTYEIAVSGILVHDGAEKRPLGHDLKIRITVP